MKLLIAILNLAIIFLFCADGFSYTPPTGIPNPMWGTLHPIDDSPTRPVDWSSEVTGSYFVNPQTGSDTGRTYGTPTAPRASVPSTIPAGSYVEITGTHSYVKIFNANGTEESPIWIVGNTDSPPTITASWTFGNAAYVILDNLTFSETVPGLRLKDGYAPHHICLRNSTLTGDGIAGGGGGVGIYGDATYNVHHIVLYNNEISYYGDWDYIGEDDRHAVKPDAYSHDIWILDGTHHHNGGDSIQIGSGVGVSASTPYNIYVGRNTFHNDGENGVDIKGSKDIIVSENTIYGYVPTGSSYGEAVVIHYNAEDVWVINNHIYDAKLGVISTGAFDLHVVGNLIHDIDELSTEAHTDISSYRSGSAITAYSTGNMYVSNNTIYDAVLGVCYEALANYECDVFDNIISNLNAGQVTSNNAYSIMIKGDNGTVAASDIDYNLFYSPVRLHVDGTTFTDIATLQSGASKCANSCLTDDPLFVSAGSNFALQGTSTAKDAGSVPAEYGKFTTDYSLSIAEDISGISRPQGSAWDIGAYEYNEAIAPQSLGTVLLGQ